MARSGGYVVLATYPSSSSDQIYEVRRGGDGVLYCHPCRGWQMSKGVPKNCKHTRDYVEKHPGTSYGPAFGSLRDQAMAIVGKPALGFIPSSASKASKKPVVVPSAPMTTAPAGVDWRARLLAEKTEAEKRGVTTPTAALQAWAKELDLD